MLKEHTPPLVVYADAPRARAAYSIKETALLIGVAVNTVRAMIADGRLEAIHLGTRVVRIPAWSIERLLRKVS